MLFERGYPGVSVIIFKGDGTACVRMGSSSHPTKGNDIIISKST